MDGGRKEDSERGGGEDRGRSVKDVCMQVMAGKGGVAGIEGQSEDDLSSARVREGL